ncbi:MAG: M23 family metallopeptidase [Holosporales bacterium]|jgi:lipoprotein NlpD|nr:M23 family metallopeptidase [Holosporales bacterium]
MFKQEGVNLRSILFSITIVLLGGCSRGDKELPEVIQKTRPNPIHTVSEEDNIGSIAAKYGMTRADLIKLNNLQQPYQLYTGQKLIVNLKPESVSSVMNVELEKDNVAVENVESTAVDNIDDKDKKPAEEPTPPNEQPEPRQETNPEDKAETVEETNKASEEQEQSDYIWPISNGKQRVTQHFGENEFDSIVIDASVGTPVKAIADGVVKLAGVPPAEAAAYGKTVIIKHPSKKTMSIYANLNEINVSVNQKVKQGTIIGKVGKTGTIARKPQLYFEIDDFAGQGRKSVDPEKLLPK